jgi:hypothetical protein
MDAENDVLFLFLEDGMKGVLGFFKEGIAEKVPRWMPCSSLLVKSIELGGKTSAPWKLFARKLLDTLIHVLTASKAPKARWRRFKKTSPT